ncbi:MAG: hypothetical protein HFJ12_01495 [Bacilli bacterium]|nr:hypothetical protein [Bacilli bacterium]
MTVKELKNKLGMYPEDTKVNIEVQVLNSEYGYIDTTIEELASTIYVDNLNVDENELHLQVIYVQKEDNSEGVIR